jgi:hypothetical protein
MGGACSVRVDIQGRKLLSGKLRNTANMGMERPLVLLCEYCAKHCVFHKISSISSPPVKLSPFLSVMTGTRRDQNVRWLEELGYSDVRCTSMEKQ